jgi:hypothetical protein
VSLGVVTNKRQLTVLDCDLLRTRKFGGEDSVVECCGQEEVSFGIMDGTKRKQYNNAAARTTLRTMYVRRQKIHPKT